MFNLSDILQNAQGGKAIENLAQQFGLSPEQTQNAVQALIPALSTALQNKANDPNALSSVVSAVTDKDHQDSFANSNAAPSPQAIQKSNDVLGDLFGSNHITNQVAQQISAVTGLRSDLLSQLLPAVTSIALGGMAHSMQNQGLGGVLGQLANAAQQGNIGNMLGQGQGQAQAQPANNSAQPGLGGLMGGGLMGMVGSLLGGLLGGGQQQQTGGTAQTSSPQSGLQSLTNMFQPGPNPASFDQSSLQNEIGRILGGR